MLKKWFEIVLVFLILGLATYCIYLKHEIAKLKVVPKIEQIDSVNTIIDTIYLKNDSLLNSVKESKVNITRIDENYKKAYIRIVNESDSSNWEFFTRYLEEQASRGLFNCNYFDSIKTN